MYTVYVRVYVCVCVVRENYLEFQFTQCLSTHVASECNTTVYIYRFRFSQSKLSQSVKLYHEGIVMSWAKLFLLPFLVFVTLHVR